MTNGEKYDTIKEKGGIELARGRKEKEVTKFRLELFDGYYVTADTRQYILNQRGKGAKEDTPNDAIGYYNTMRNLIKDLAQRKLRSAEVKTIDDLLSEMNRLERNIEKLFPDYEIVKI